jgi:hypothetical protein
MGIFPKRDICQRKIMHFRSRMMFVAFVALLCASRMCAAATPATPLSIALQIVPDASFIDLNAPDQTGTLRQASTPIRLSITGGTLSPLHPIAVYACLDGEDAMRLAGKTSTLSTATLRIRDAQGQWTEPEPLTELEGRRGVRIAVVDGASAQILLQVQLQVPSGQRPGNYQGSLMLMAQER